MSNREKYYYYLIDSDISISEGNRTCLEVGVYDPASYGYQARCRNVVISEFHDRKHEAIEQGERFIKSLWLDSDTEKTAPELNI